MGHVVGQITQKNLIQMFRLEMTCLFCFRENVGLVLYLSVSVSSHNQSACGWEITWKIANGGIIFSLPTGGGKKRFTSLVGKKTKHFPAVINTFEVARKRIGPS